MARFVLAAVILRATGLAAMCDHELPSRLGGMYRFALLLASCPHSCRSSNGDGCGYPIGLHMSYLLQLAAASISTATTAELACPDQPMCRLGEQEAAGHCTSTVVTQHEQAPLCSRCVVESCSR